jgi:eukaryotic-like serine/threonine-protein kinase
LFEKGIQPVPEKVRPVPVSKKETHHLKTPRPASTGKPKPNTKWVWFTMLGLVVFGVIFSAVRYLPQWLNSLSPTPTPKVEPTLFRSPTPTATITPTPGIGSTMVRQADQMVMVYVPEGEFIMGSPAGVGDDDEHPQHVVTLDAYWIDRTEVTNAQYEKCVQVNVCGEKPEQARSSGTRSNYYTDPQYSNYPVIYIRWDSARTYCDWVGGRLPTEAEWEKAARGTDGRVYPWGNASISCALANITSCAGGDTTEVGSYKDGASPYGALDMAGNVWEWVSDYYDPNYYAGYYSNNPKGPSSGPSSGPFWIIRGGAYDFTALNARSAERKNIWESEGHETMGFRCVYEP